MNLASFFTTLPKTTTNRRHVQFGPTLHSSNTLLFDHGSETTTETCRLRSCFWHWRRACQGTHSTGTSASRIYKLTAIPYTLSLGKTHYSSSQKVMDFIWPVCFLSFNLFMPELYRCWMGIIQVEGELVAKGYNSSRVLTRSFLKTSTICIAYQWWRCYWSYKSSSSQWNAGSRGKKVWYLIEDPSHCICLVDSTWTSDSITFSYASSRPTI